MSRSLSNEMKRLIGVYRKDKCINVVAPVVLRSTHCGRLILLVGRVTRSCTCAVYARRVRVRSVRPSESCETALIRLPTIVSLPCSCPAQPSPARPYRVGSTLGFCPSSAAAEEPQTQQVNGVISTRLLQGMCRVKDATAVPSGVAPLRHTGGYHVGRYMAPDCLQASHTNFRSCDSTCQPELGVLTARVAAHSKRLWPIPVDVDREKMLR